MVLKHSNEKAMAAWCVWNPRVFADDARGWQCPFVLCLHPQGRGTFGGRRKAVRDRLALQGGTGDFP